MGAQASQVAPARAAGRGYRVKLAITALDMMTPTTAYHTSVMVDDLEYCFSNNGIVTGRSCQSHEKLRENTEIVDCGLSSLSGEQLCCALGQFFQKGTYDMLRKNCNSFSSCALCYLLDNKLDPKYQSMESWAVSFDEGLVGFFSGGSYRKNPMALDFNIDEAIEEMQGGFLMCPGSTPEAFSLGQPQAIRRPSEQFRVTSDPLISARPVVYHHRVTLAH
eukprot:TRINITY_DN5763_c0_g1_i2.p1 TRINITY_DN5763_c0_g1~~TRINITY_DN5763_c0_g1_i2.p1  ORF type:complete len:242 (-),score=29.89 TRINITY_DN5763_c0_g1_i2:123-782(-)